MTAASPTLRVARRMTATLWPVAAGYWAIMAAVALTVGVTVGAFGEIKTSLVQYPLLNAPKYFLMVFGILATTMQLPIYVAHGVTRREFIRGAAVFFAALATAFTALQLVALGIEYAVYSAQDLLPRLTEAHPLASAGDAGRLFLQTLLLGLAYLATGWLIGVGYYRFGPWLGTAFIVPACLPAVATEAAFNARLIGLDVAALPIALVLSAAIIAVAWAACYALTRSLAIKKITG
jgi:hypothetical protein